MLIEGVGKRDKCVPCNLKNGCMLMEGHKRLCLGPFYSFADFVYKFRLHISSLTNEEKRGRMKGVK